MPYINAKRAKFLRTRKNEIKDGINDLGIIAKSRECVRYVAMVFKELLGRPVKLHIIEDNPDVTAFTDGISTTVNCRCSLFTSRGTLEMQFLAMFGAFLHELAHMLYLDFNLEKIAMSYLDKGLFYGGKPSNLTAAQDADWTDMTVALNEPRSRSIFKVAFHSLSNIISDVHDENALIKRLGNFAAEPLYVLRGALRETCEFFEDSVKRVEAGEMQELAMLFNMILQLCRFGDVITDDYETAHESKYWKLLDAIRPHAKIACVTDDTVAKYREMSWILLYLWPYIRSESDDQKNNDQGSGSDDGSDNGSGSNSGAGIGSSQQGQTGEENDDSNGQPAGNQSSSGNQSSQNSQNGSSGGGGSQQRQPLTQEQIQKILDALKEGAQKAGATTEQKNQKSSETAVQRRAAAKQGGQSGDGQEAEGAAAQDGENPFEGESIGMLMDQIVNQIAESQAEAEMEAETTSNILAEVATADQTSPHKGRTIDAKRHIDVSDRDRDTWDRMMQDWKSISKRAQRQLMAELRDLNEGSIDKRKIFGKHLDVNDTYRLDKRCFSTKKAPEDYPDMAVSLLVDQSGSMSGQRIQEAMKAAMLVYDFCTGINIPVSVAGHSVVEAGHVKYDIYTEHDKISKNDKYRLSQMRCGGCNRDGAAINVSASILNKRNERIKLLLIISDGQPNDDSYGGESAREDIREIAQKCRRHGIEVIAAAIGDDQERIKEIYQDNYLNISDLNKLPKELVKIIRKRIVNAAF